MQALQVALERAGVEFIEENGGGPVGVEVSESKITEGIDVVASAHGQLRRAPRKLARVVDLRLRRATASAGSRPSRREKAADHFEATASVEISSGHSHSDSASKTARPRPVNYGLRPASRRAWSAQPLMHTANISRLHIEPYLGKVKLSQLSSPIVREFEDKLARGDMPEGAERRSLDPSVLWSRRCGHHSLLC